MQSPDYPAMLEAAIAEARKGLTEGGIPIGAAIFDENGTFSAPATTAGCRMAILRCMAKPMPFAMQGGSAAIGN